MGVIIIVGVIIMKEIDYHKERGKMELVIV